MPFPQNRTLPSLLMLALDRRTYRILWKERRLYPLFWVRAFWDPDARLVLKARRKGAAQKIRELYQLIRLLRKRDLKTVVEIGTARGGTFYALCQLARDEGTIVSIDLPGGPFGGGHSRQDRELFQTYGRPNQELRFISGDSHDPSTKDELVRLLRGKTIDFLMIDGDHTYEGVKRDFELYSPMVAHNGLIAFHDILPHPNSPDCEVHVFWSEIREDHAVSEFVDTYDSSRARGQWGGIGVLPWRR